MTASAPHTPTLTSLPLLARGPVRAHYAVGDARLLMVSRARILASAVLLSQPIPVSSPPLQLPTTRALDK